MTYYILLSLRLPQRQVVLEQAAEKITVHF